MRLRAQLASVPGRLVVLDEVASALEDGMDRLEVPLRVRNGLDLVEDAQEIACPRKLYVNRE